MKSPPRKASLFVMLLLLSLLLLMAQSLFFFIHYSLGSLLDSLARSPLASSLYYPFQAVIWLPILNYCLAQLLAYFFVISWVWYRTNEIAAIFNLTPRQTYFAGLLLWINDWILLFALNGYFFPNSFFAVAFPTSVLLLSAFICFYSSLVALMNFMMAPRHRWIGSFLNFTILLVIGVELNDAAFFKIPPSTNTKPNIILIGLDSLRPDVISPTHTPHLTQFLQKATVYDQAYTPLARTYPSWISLLTGKYPKHNGARMNLNQETVVLQNEMLSQRLQQAGYHTIYGTDEPRFTDIGKEYGYNNVVGPKGGAVEFILGTISDFPLVNLLSNLSIGRFIFPYNYANRAINFAYRPEKFINLVKHALQERPLNQPLFLSIHLCLSHWPFTWANSKEETLLAHQYLQSVSALDKQFASLYQLLDEASLLTSSIVVVFSDHGVTLGMKHDRLITSGKYQGDLAKLGLISSYKLSSAPEIINNVKTDFSIDTSYGQGTDVLSTKQYQILLSFQKDQTSLPVVRQFASTIDIAPTILDLLDLDEFKDADGISLLHDITNRAFYLETADTFADMENDKIFIAKLVKEAINGYELDVHRGYLYINPIAKNVILKNKQRAVIKDNWMLAYYPAQTKYSLEKNTQGIMTMQPKLIPSYFVIANLKTGDWSIGFDSVFAKHAPLVSLQKAFNRFYGDEIRATTVATGRLFDPFKLYSFANYVG